MRTLLLFIIVLFTVSSIQSQSLRQMENKHFNFGATVGFNASFPIVKSLTLNEVDVENIRLKYKVGYSASVFCRMNFDRFFIQPSFSWQRSEGEIHFTVPETVTDATSLFPTDQLTLTTYSLDIPIQIGYHLVKQGPYALSLMAGPTLKYNYDVSYTSNVASSYREFVSDNTPLGIGFAGAISVSIWRLFLDFGYEFGLNRIESDFKDKYSQDPISGSDISINKRTNKMSFALGFVF